MNYVLTLQGPTVEGNLLMESWEIPPELYARVRARLVDSEPTVTTLTDADAKVISQRFAGDDDGQHG